jgi:predicted RNase H-like nuclease (RuvC/YqgF family)
MTSEIITQILLAILACAWIGDFIKGFYQRKKVQAETSHTEASATQVIVGTATTLVAPLAARIKELETETTILRTSLKEATAEADRLVRQLENATSENKRVTAENRQLRLKLAGGSL